jgi:superfamily II DNA/RNA helicase
VTTIATAFNTLPLSAAMLANLDSLGYAEMTQIQAQSLPVILKGLDPWPRMSKQDVADRLLELTLARLAEKKN